MTVPLTVVLPARTRLRCSRRHARRRVGVVASLAALLVALAPGVGQVLANRGGDPASTPAVRPAGTDYIVRRGDTIWSIAADHRGPVTQDRYVERLVEDNGGTSLMPGQLLRLP